MFVTVQQTGSTEETKKTKWKSNSPLIKWLLVIILILFFVNILSMNYNTNSSNNNTNDKEYNFDPYLNKQLQNKCPVAPLRKSIAILLLTYNRSNYLNQTLYSLFSLPQISNYSIYISQDGNVPSTTQVLNQVVRSRLDLQYTIWRRERDFLLEKLPSHSILASHYQFALDKLFSTKIIHQEMYQGKVCNYEKYHDLAILIEDDMKFAPDFLHLFEQTHHLLYTDESTLWCISSYNYHGYHYFDLNSQKLKRTNLFPGLGWMLRRELYTTVLQPKWPTFHWDLWLRGVMLLQQKDCLFPEVSRNYNFGEMGANVKSTEFLHYFANNRLQETVVKEFERLDLLHSTNYENYMKQQIQLAQVIKTDPTQLHLLRDQIEEWTRNKQTKRIVTSYAKEQYEHYKNQFKLFRMPLNSFMHMIEFKPTPFVTIYLGDARSSDLLPQELRIKRREGVKEVVGKQGQSCVQVCKENGGLNCIKEELDFLNHCNVLSKYFPCNNGCAIETGSDLPNYVSDIRNQVHFGKCLITEERTTCAGSHDSTSRLCPCGIL